MRKYRNIKALFFLGILSMLLMHKVVPHWHHQHVEEHHHDVAHNHHDHHSDETEKENPTKGFLDWFFEMHAHTNTTTDILVLKQRTVEKVSVEKLIAKTRFPKLVIYTFYKSDTIVKKWYRPPDKLRKAYLFNYSLRGPPSLG
ncbi:hypothetical protein GO009_15590 [Muricauda sp. TY007]|uniref:hypothetical protein n=1 Tax=Allomuricauda sp. TY007 TaxID=2683200 RepID=UPI000C0B6785|nr:MULTISPECIES: hypothetical protein [unclassified Allomuricauda]MAU16582.1 hypothetical protein [Allomuricauda sp.]NDV17444.1 hypothetical protein [Muricauda sp. TY007]